MAVLERNLSFVPGFASNLRALTGCSGISGYKHGKWVRTN